MKYLAQLLKSHDQGTDSTDTALGMAVPSVPIQNKNVEDGTDMSVSLVPTPHDFSSYIGAFNPESVLSMVFNIKTRSSLMQNLFLDQLSRWVQSNQTPRVTALAEQILTAWNRDSLDLSVDELIGVFMARFVNNRITWGKQRINKEQRAVYDRQKPGQKWFPYEQFSADLFMRIIIGEVSAALCAIGKDNQSRWICFDSDEDVGELEKLEAFLQQCGWSCVREGRRPGRAGHLWLLIDQPVAADKLIIVADTMLKQAGVCMMERFPKATSNTSREGISLVRCPFSINLKAFCLEGETEEVSRGWFDGIPYDIVKQLQFVASIPLNKAEDVEREASLHQTKRMKALPPRRLLSASVPDRSRYINILEHVTFSEVGNELWGQCPACVELGMDTHGDNLRATLDGRLFNCVEGGTDQGHKPKEIVAAIVSNERFKCTG